MECQIRTNNVSLCNLYSVHATVFDTLNKLDKFLWGNSRENRDIEY